VVYETDPKLLKNASIQKLEEVPDEAWWYIRHLAGARQQLLTGLDQFGENIPAIIEALKRSGNLAPDWDQDERFYAGKNPDEELIRIIHRILLPVFGNALDAAQLSIEVAHEELEALGMGAT
jgi:hypothetical protein